ncbi:disease resistance protein SUMM2-like [Dioscorea cayenensis subsp. rotundata]|uniref:Disease resistance protein SUMM2-like n=1 Tax=Dioscorea cayennensis subsp. rotundata TaxID=55577 RepID=A0AB40ANU1_DIOCR|nr:disease resistance protein SUMM2-like [Dioscorea cayenensis subsp. rotundata]
MPDPFTLCLAPCCSCFQSQVVRNDMSNVFCTEEKLDELKNAMEALVVKKKEIVRELDIHQNKGKQPTHPLQLQLWIRKVGEKNEKVTKLLDEYSKSCCVSRYSISRRAIKLLKRNKSVARRTIASRIHRAIASLNQSLNHLKIVGEKIVSNLNVTCNYLEEKTNDIIGIWGMGGVGKTTLLKKINQRLLDNANMGFDHVLFIKASQNTQFEELQKEIAKKLHLSPDSAGQQDIFNALKTKNIVLLLDNIWEPVDLVGLGIINPFRDDDDSTKYKVIFTTRSEDVCARMRASKRIKVECLEPDEAWTLFKHNVNLAVIESDEKFKKIARQAMNKCGGLPLALQVVGAAMPKTNTVQDWEGILSSLNNLGTKVVQGVQDSLLPILKLSYDTLPRNTRECFLYASLLPWSLSKDDLLECWMGLGLISNFDNLQQAYHEARQIFKKLEESCLLWYSPDDDDVVVRLHDVIYEMAVWIASDYGENMNKWIVKKYDGLAVEIPSKDAENWKSANVLFIRGRVKRLPILSHQCSDLLYLMVEPNYHFENIRKGFFRQTPNLTYLNLEATSIKELPKDIKCLVNLQYLNISGTEISSLPKELVYLKKLQYLICNHLERLGKVEDLMSRLQMLKVIDIFPSGWGRPRTVKEIEETSPKP